VAIVHTIFSKNLGVHFFESSVVEKSICVEVSGLIRVLEDARSGTHGLAARSACQHATCSRRFVYSKSLVKIMQRIDLIPLETRACDLCNDSIIDEGRKVVKSFVLTDWGAICIECWDHRISASGSFRVVRAYIKSMIIDDDWIKRPLVFLTAP